MTDMQQHYNHIANQNIAQNAAAKQEWINSHSPEEIYNANVAREGLSKRTKGYVVKIKDERLVKRPRNAYTFFVKERYTSGDFKGIKVPEATSLITREYKGLTDSEKKVSAWSLFQWQVSYSANTMDW